MKRLVIALAALGFVQVAGAAEPAAPHHWDVTGGKPQDYSVSLDVVNPHGGKKSALIRSVVPNPTSFGALVQVFSAADYRGKRLRLSAFVRSQDVSQWAGLWMRLDGMNAQVLGFDNMQNRPIKGDTEWQRYSVVLDVPEAALAVHFGILLAGAGSVWLNDVSLDTVPSSVPTTGLPLSTPFFNELRQRSAPPGAGPVVLKPNTR
jgi:hypothetical protein